jgi:bla regulator protein blaR1
MAEILAFLYAAALVSTLSIASILLLRTPLRRTFGASPAYLSWLTVPVALLALALPGPRSTLTALPLPGRLVDAVTDAIVRATTATSTAANVIFVLWVTGATLAAALLMLRQRRFIRSLGRLVRQHGVAYAAPRGVTPIIVGCLRPVIVLPQNFESRYTREEQALILAHERTHVRRGDLIALALWSLIRCLLWFNPLIHLATEPFRFDQELACDASTLRASGGSRKAYASALLKTLVVDTAAAPLSSAWHAHDPLKQRVLSLRTPRPTRAQQLLGLAVIGALVCAAAWGSGALQPIGAYHLAIGPKPAPAMCPLEATKKRLLLAHEATAQHTHSNSRDLTGG